jgi:hypothetical protein
MPWATNQDKIVRDLRKKGDKNAIDDHFKNNSGDKYIDYFREKYNDYDQKENYYLMQWKYQHKRWNFTNCPIFFDTGDGFLYMSIESIKIWNGFVVKRFNKESFIERFLF